MDLGFDDELSEDWISQPRSSAAPSLRGGSSPANTRLKGSTRQLVGLSGSTVERTGAHTATASLRKSKRPLKEQSLSDLNIAKESQRGKESSEQTVESIGENESPQLPPEHVGDGTIQIERSPGRHRTANNETPEWRRRLIDGKRALADQQDLFSSRGIEQFFGRQENVHGVNTPQKPSPGPKKSMLPLPTRAGDHEIRPKAKDDLAGSREARDKSPAIAKLAGIEKPRDIQGPNPDSETFSDIANGPIRRRSRTLSGTRQSTHKDGAREEAAEQRPSSRSSDSVLYGSGRDADSVPTRTSCSREPRQFSTQHFLARSGKFVTISRGSAEADISFSLRSLSPVSFGEEAFAAAASRPQPENDTGPLSDPAQPKSPLKLFAENDSFTSRRLHRRVSQLDNNTKLPSVNAVAGELGSDEHSNQLGRGAAVHGLRKCRRVSNFGVGDLDEHLFEPESSIQELPAMSLSQPRVPSLAQRAIEARRSVSLDTYNSHPTDSEIEELDSPKLPAMSNNKRILAPARYISLTKRRRTSYISSDSNALQPNQSHLPRNHNFSVSGHKRKDARYEPQPASMPEDIAKRPKLVAVGPTQRKSSQARSLMPSTEQGKQREDESHVIRKKSLTTADFFNEANAIMQKIRAQDHQPRSSLGSFQPPTNLGSDQDSSLFHEEFTIEQLSRPASREGTDHRKHPTPLALDARIISHLRQFEDSGDFGLEWSSSSRPAQQMSTKGPEIIERDPPNIRIREQRLGSQGMESGQLAIESPTHGHTQASSQGSTVNSIPTGSSRESAGKATISPDKVSHLINMTMGGMTFDPKRLCWVKQKPRPSLHTTAEANSELSEDNPLRDIPDLTVNESQEVRTTRSQRDFPILASHGGEAKVPSQSPLAVQALFSDEQDQSSLTTSNVHPFTSSGPIIETRATSWGDLPARAPHGKTSGSIKCVVRPTTETEQAKTNTTSQEITSNSPEKQFSSRSSEGAEEHSPHMLQRTRAVEDEANGEDSGSQLTQPSNTEAEQGKQNQSVMFVEGSLLDAPQHQKNENMGLTLSTPQPRQLASLNSQQLPESSVSYKTLHLSPLPDFTVNQLDESLNLDMGYVARRRGLASIPEIEKNFSLAIEDLVSKITDIEPYEPYWEYMQKLDLNGQKLWTLHMLADFCCRVEELEVSGNELGQLNGAPRSLRVLTARGNHLSSLTAWTHLPNLQYLNVSYNQISTLDSFACLVHLRDLNLEGNEIEELEGIEGLTNLIHLKLGHNLLKKLDLRGISMSRLRSLDVQGNEIEEVLGLECLKSLRELNVRNNKLTHFSCTRASLPESLRRLDLSYNELSVMDVSDAPCLDTLLIDHNHVSYIKGLARNESIQKLSWRHQVLDTESASESPEYNCSTQVHYLDLTENRIPLFTPRTSFLNLRRLCLQSCGIEALGEDFGSLMPNLRSINLNDNGLKDIRPLLGIAMLEELHIARNRITRLRLTTKVLLRFATSLLYLDCRDNPLTVGFYPRSIAESGSLKTGTNNGLKPKLLEDRDKHEAQDPTTASRIDRTEDADYVNRLDEETLLRRRVYEALLVHECKAMVFWDGLDMEYRREADRKATWARLVDLEVLPRIPN